MGAWSRREARRYAHRRGLKLLRGQFFGREPFAPFFLKVSEIFEFQVLEIIIGRQGHSPHHLSDRAQGRFVVIIC